MPPGDLQMSDQELAAEAARSRTVGLASVATVALFSTFVLCSYLALKDGQAGENAKYLTAIAENKFLYIAAGFCFAIAQLLVAVLLTHILFAVRTRTTSAPKLPLYVAIIGPALVALSYPAYTLANVLAAGDFAAAAHQTAELANQQANTSAIEITRGIWLVGQGLLTFAWLSVGIFGMRVGLLTRMVGTFAMAIGVASFVAPPFAALLQVFWVSAMALMLIGDGEKIPPAWRLGRPVPWREVDAMREQLTAEGAGAEEPAETDEPAKAEEPAEAESKQTDGPAS